MKNYAMTNSVLNGNAEMLKKKVYQRLAYGILIGKYHFQDFDFSDKPMDNHKIIVSLKKLSSIWKEEEYQSICTFSQLKKLEDFAYADEQFSADFGLWVDIYLYAQNPIVVHMAEEHILSFCSEEFDICYNFLLKLNHLGSKKLSIAVQDKFSQVLQQNFARLTEENWKAIFSKEESSKFSHRQIELLAAEKEISSEMANILIWHLANCCQKKDWNFNYQQFMTDLALFDGKCFCNCQPKILEDIEFIFSQGFLSKHFSEAYRAFQIVSAKILLNIEHIDNEAPYTGPSPAYYAAQILLEHLPADLILPICETLPDKVSQKCHIDFMELQRELTRKAKNLLPAENSRVPQILEFVSGLNTLLNISKNFIDEELLDFLLQLSKHPVYEDDIAYFLQSYLSNKDYYQQHLLESIFNNGFNFRTARLRLDGNVLFNSMKKWQGRKSPLFKKIMTMLINRMAADGKFYRHDKENWCAKSEFYNYSELSKELKKDFALMQKEYDEQERQEQEYLDSLL